MALYTDIACCSILALNYEISIWRPAECAVVHMWVSVYQKFKFCTQLFSKFLVLNQVHDNCVSINMLTLMFWHCWNSQIHFLDLWKFWKSHCDAVWGQVWQSHLRNLISVLARTVNINHNKADLLYRILWPCMGWSQFGEKRFTERRYPCSLFVVGKIMKAH